VQDTVHSLFAFMASTGPNTLSQTVSSFNSSFVKFVGTWQSNAAKGVFTISHPPVPASVAFSFNGEPALLF
jgi:hypothetical protein